MQGARKRRRSAFSLFVQEFPRSSPFSHVDFPEPGAVFLFRRNVKLGTSSRRDYLRVCVTTVVRVVKRCSANRVNCSPWKEHRGLNGRVWECRATVGLESNSTREWDLIMFLSDRSESIYLFPYFVRNVARVLLLANQSSVATSPFDGTHNSGHRLTVSVRECGNRRSIMRVEPMN